MAGCAPEGVFGLKDGVGHKLAGVLVFQPVEHACSVLPGGYQAREAHLRQMLGYRGRGFMDHLGEPADWQFALAQGKNNPHPCGVSQHGKDFDGQFHVLAVRFPPAYRFICIHTYIVSYG